MEINKSKIEEVKEELKEEGLKDKTADKIIN